jgi:hypothetical protein
MVMVLVLNRDVFHSKARDLAAEEGLPQLEAYSYWLKGFKNRHGIA